VADSPAASPFAAQGGELHLSNQGQLELLRGMRERGASLRTPVHGWSMTPFIRDGDVVTVAPIGAAEPRLGEVLAVELAQGPRLVIHRVVRREVGGWLMRGDNATAPDGVVLREQVLGRVVRVRRKGREVRLGLGPERALIATLSRSGALLGLVRVARRLRRAAGAPRGS
jgi:hypothetical protein